MASSAMAQPVVDSAPMAPGSGLPEAKVPASLPKEAGPASATPSRFVGTSELNAYVESLNSIFLIRSRVRDPFGQAQDPDAKPVIKAPVAQKAHHIAPVLAIQFSEIVQKIVVTTIMPGERRFLVGTRSVKQGDQLPLSFRGKQIRVEVTDVTSRQIEFRNLDTGEIASRKLDMLPIGMTPGHHGITAPGMTPDRPNAPIELEAGNPVP